MAGLWPAHSLVCLPLVVCFVWGKLLSLLPRWVKWLIVGLLQAICGGLLVVPLCWVGRRGKGAVLGLKMLLPLIPIICRLSSYFTAGHNLVGKWGFITLYLHHKTNTQ